MTQENTPAVSDAAASSDVAEATPTPKRRTTRRSSRAKTPPAAEETATLTASPATDAAQAAADNGDAQATDAAATAPRKPARRSSRRKTTAPAAENTAPEAAPAAASAEEAPAQTAAPEAAEASADTDGEQHAAPRRGTRRSPGAQRRQRTPRKKSPEAASQPAEASPAESGDQTTETPAARPADDQPAVTAEAPAAETPAAPAAKAVPDSEDAATAAAAESSEAAAADTGSQEDGEEQPRRKSRRGRRGGRGRNRKNREAQAENAEPADKDTEESAETAAPADLPDDLSDEELWQAATGDVETLENAPARPRRRGEDSEAPKKGSVRAAAVKAKVAAGKRRMFISVLPGEQVEVAIAEEGRLQEYYLDMFHQRKLKGNIYKGVIHNIDTNLQAAFVSYGAGKNGFLQIDEIHPEYWLTHHEPSKGKKFPPIQKVLKPGQEVLVQVVKEPTGNKGAFLTTWLSLAGRFLVLTPGQEQIGVSRKVDSDEERTRLREMMNGIDPGQGLGVIVRTVSAGTTKTTLKNDLQYLKRVWKDIRKKATEVSAPALIYQEPGLPQRAVRDYLTDDVCEIWVDNEEVADSIRETVSLLFPRKKELVRLHTDVRMPLWERFSLRRQLDQIYSREVTLPSGGRLVFDQTEALMAVDINSGKISGKVNFESMAHRTNMEAAEAIARQLKLRDIGGQVVIDFIEMRDKKHVLEVEKTLRTAMKNDRARHDVGRMSSFGLLELVRQRTGSSALSITMEPCPFCGGTGQRRNLEWQALQALREMRRALRTHGGDKYVFETTRELGLYLLNHKRDSLRDMEQDFGKCLEISIRP
ncbi:MULTISPECIES: Rne/Rng family ribonuclease [Desulfovibrio]|uniref:Rne/Rng family ribonuclease n=1 Tax=Desulfovibrio TaxID=872 RepID=UPI0026EA7FB8|nr:MULTISPECIES: Rne/Rng family ribonuclease [Desulfovibrio]MCI7616233.1 Rne/Rng family ribonuclease [Desulfovibrio piger]MDY4807937.1 Rne/Rng family ribonuclease [Desulfovibrio sp.]